MSKKKNVLIYIDEDVAREAKELGLNVSRTCELALKQAIGQLRVLYSKNNPKNPLANPHNNVGASGGIRTRDLRLTKAMP